MGPGSTLLSAFLALSQVYLSLGQVCEQKADVVLVVDRVLPLHGLDANHWDRLLSFVVSITSGLNLQQDHTRVGMVAFNKSAVNEFYLHDTGTPATVSEAIMVTKASYEATEINVADAFRVMRTDQFSSAKGDRPDVPNIAIVIIGGPTTNANDADIQASYAKDENIKIYTVGVGMEDIAILQSLSSPPQEENRNYFNAKNIINLEALLGDLRNAICSSVDQPPMEVPIDDPEYFQNNPSEELLDLVFVIDNSDSIKTSNPEDGSYDNWAHMMQLIISVVESLKVDPNWVRIGIVTFSDRARAMQFLSESKSKQNVVDNIRTLQHNGGGANLADALRVMRDMFVQDSKKRPFTDVAVILSTGHIDAGTRQAVLEQAENAHQENIHIVSIGIGSLIDKETLREISSPPQILDHNYFLSPPSPKTIIEHLIPSDPPVEEEVENKDTTVTEKNNGENTAQGSQNNPNLDKQTSFTIKHTNMNIFLLVTLLFVFHWLLE